MKGVVILLLMLAGTAICSERKVSKSDAVTQLNGTWTVTGGMAFTPPHGQRDIGKHLETDSLTAVIRDGRVTLKLIGKGHTFPVRDFPLKLGKMGSNELDILNVIGKLPVKCIYKVDSDSLTVSFHFGNWFFVHESIPRPSRFDQSDEWNMFTFTFTRVMEK